MAEVTLVEAVRMALARAMADDDRVLILGEDVGRDGGVFRATDGLLVQFGEQRVRDTPLAEQAIAGLSVGLAAQGLRPVAEIQFMGFIYPAIDQLLNHAARLRTRTRGRLTCPMVLRAPFGGGIHAPEHHSESTEAMFAHIPGLRVVIPSSPRRAYGLLLAAIRDPDPVVFLEPKRIYRSIKEEVMDDGNVSALDRCHVLREGTDITLVTWGAMTVETLAAADSLASAGVQAEVIDLATVKPIDMATILESVERTGRCVIVHEAARTCGIGAEVAACIAQDGLMSLLAPVQRVTGYDTVMPLPSSSTTTCQGPHALSRPRARPCPLAERLDTEDPGAQTADTPMQAQQFRLPDLGEGLTESEVVAWHVSEGDHVVADQPLVSVETEKAVVEVPSPFAGTVVRLCAAPGDIVKVGQPLVEFDSGPAKGSADTGTVVGEIPAVPPAADADIAGKQFELERRASPARLKGARAAPAVRQRAHELGLDLSTVAGTGPSDGVTMADVERAAGLRPRSEADEPANWLPLRGIRRTMARQMSRAGAQVVPATLTDEADVNGWPAHDTPEADPTLRLVQAISAACSAEPALNAWYDPEAGARLLHRDLRLGVAVDTNDGLIVPVVEIDDTEDAHSLRSRLEQPIADARQRLVAPQQLTGATFTLSNFGMLGGRHAALVVVPPQVAILGAGRIRSDVVAENGVPVIHRVMPLSLTFDHRAVSGGEAARFMGAVIAALQ